MQKLISLAFILLFSFSLSACSKSDFGIGSSSPKNEKLNIKEQNSVAVRTLAKEVQNVMEDLKTEEDLTAEKELLKKSEAAIDTKPQAAAMGVKKVMRMIMEKDEAGMTEYKTLQEKSVAASAKTETMMADHAEETKILATGEFVTIDFLHKANGDVEVIDLERT